MKQFTPAPVRSPQQETVAYRPFAPLAVISIICACAFAVIVIVWGGVCFSYGAPLVLPTGVLLLPIAAAVMGLFARRQIQNSEGTRSGTSLAASAFWISLLFFVCYGALYLGTYLAVWWQAQRFTDAWVAMVRAGKLEEAFLQTRKPVDRKDEDPKNVERLWIRFGRGAKDELTGPLPAFKESEIVRVLQDPTAKVEQTGMRRWDFEAQSYFVDQSYRVTTREGVFSLVLKTQSFQSKEFQGRQWQLRWNPEGEFDSKAFSTQGEELDRLRRMSATPAANLWLTWRNSGDLPHLYVHTMPVSKRADALRHYAARLTAGALANTGLAPSTFLGALAPVLSPLDAARLYLDGFETYPWNKLVRDDNFVAMATDQERKKMVGDVRALLLVPPGPMQINPNARQARPLPSDNPDVVRMAQDVQIKRWDRVDGRLKEVFRCEGYLIIESEPGDLSSADPHWHIVGLELTRGGPPPTPRKAPSEGS